jgi:2-hydroxy-3-oxopropionate reductase
VLGISLPNTATAHGLFNACVIYCGKTWDHFGMIRALEAMHGQLGDREPYAIITYV